MHYARSTVAMEKEDFNLDFSLNVCDNFDDLVKWSEVRGRLEKILALLIDDVCTIIHNTIIHVRNTFYIEKCAIKRYKV